AGTGTPGPCRRQCAGRCGAGPPSPGSRRCLGAAARPAPLGAAAFHGPAADDLVQHGGARLGPQHAAEPLDVLAGGRAAADDDGDVGVGHIDALVQHAARDELGVAPRPKVVEDGLTLAGLGAVGDGRQAEAAAELVDQGVVLGEDDHVVAAVLVQQLGHAGDLRLRVQRDQPRLLVRAEGAAGGGVVAAAADEVLEEVGAAGPDLPGG